MRLISEKMEHANDGLTIRAQKRSEIGGETISKALDDEELF